MIRSETLLTAATSVVAGMAGAVVGVISTLTLMIVGFLGLAAPDERPLRFMVLTESRVRLVSWAATFAGNRRPIHRWIFRAVTQ